MAGTVITSVEPRRVPGAGVPRLANLQVHRRPRRAVRAAGDRAWPGTRSVALFPLFAVVRWTKIFENSTDYSLQNTTRHALFLPTSREAKYKAKQAIDAFFVRAGDLLQAVVVFVGIELLAFSDRERFALVNVVARRRLAACSPSRSRASIGSSSAPKLTARQGGVMHCSMLIWSFSHSRSASPRLRALARRSRRRAPKRCAREREEKAKEPRAARAQSPRARR